MTRFTRRQAIGMGLGAAAAARLRTAAADTAQASHGMSAFGDLKYPADFHHFDYVNIDAPKGGVFSTIPSVKAYNQSYQTFNSLNAF
ncbi:MAG TPA: ABC transporter substrate-binding protein, partial [Nitrobacter sp.]|nr:ABC transporter substrate-binding protein [Nitrobacter sp.]